MTYWSQEPETIIPVGDVASAQTLEVCPKREYTGSVESLARLKTLIIPSCPPVITYPNQHQSSVHNSRRPHAPSGASVDGGMNAIELIKPSLGLYVAEILNFVSDWDLDHAIAVESLEADRMRLGEGEATPLT